MAKLSPLDEQRLLVKVSKMYYEEGLAQDDIILRLNLSRSKISRLLQQARDEGIVQITVSTPRHLFSDLETSLEKTYGLDEAIVVEAHAEDSHENVIHGLGVAAAGYLERSVGATTTLGISWGSTLHSMVAALHAKHLPKTKVVQIIGGLGQPEAEVHATDLCHRLARSLGSQLTLLPVPGIGATQDARNVLLSDPYVQQATEMFNHLDLAFVGIGAPVAESVLIRDGSILSCTELDCLLQSGAVGDIALRFFDAQGQPIQSEIDQRVIGITFEQLKLIRRVVGIAGGPEKLQAIRGALRGKLINVLITDSKNAEKLLQTTF
ncbi:MAG TPA: sugar-binding transcriptional regulator [Anaerolineales bacterium]|nr:sugar-binding transcriptional regulator [Anaerolineales bacterium]